MLTDRSIPDDPETVGHIVQFADADETLLANVTEYLLAGWAQGEALLVIATPERNAAFVRALRQSGSDPDAAIRERRLLFAEAEQTLSRFLDDGQPDWHRFQRTIGALIAQLRPRPEDTGLRTYSEMVGILWKASLSAAIRVEQFWNEFLSAHSLHLFCSYPINVFGKDFHPATLRPLLSAHTHLVPSRGNRDLGSAVDRAMDEILGPSVRKERSLFSANDPPAWPIMPEAEASILWLRSNFPLCADEILARARQYFQISRQSEHSPNANLRSAVARGIP